MDTKKRKAIQIVLLALAAFMIIYGISTGETAIVLKKAINICFECIGLG